MFAPTRLTTDRLLLRPLGEADEPALFALFSHPQVMRYWSSPAWTSPAQAHQLVAFDHAAMARGEHLRLGLELRQGRALVGTCTLFNGHAASRRAELGYSLAPAHWGRGLMHEALGALLRHGFETLQLHRVEADVDPRNHASARVLERLGFVREGLARERWIVAGELSDSALYGLLHRDWAALR